MKTESDDQILNKAYFDTAMQLPGLQVRIIQGACSGRAQEVETTTK